MTGIRQPPNEKENMLGFHNLQIQCRCLQGNRPDRDSNCIHDPQVGAELVRGISEEKAIPRSTVVGVYEEDRGVKCKDCMKEKDWKDLKPEGIITVDEIKRGAALFICEYCKKTL